MLRRIRFFMSSGWLTDDVGIVADVRRVVECEFEYTFDVVALAVSKCLVGLVTLVAVASVVFVIVVVGAALVVELSVVTG